MLCGVASSAHIIICPVLSARSAYRHRSTTSITAWLSVIAGLFVTSVLGSVFRAVLTVSRTAFIWAFDVALYYSAWSYGAMLLLLHSRVPAATLTTSHAPEAMHACSVTIASGSSLRTPNAHPRGIARRRAAGRGLGLAVQPHPAGGLRAWPRRHAGLRAGHHQARVLHSFLSGECPMLLAPRHAIQLDTWPAVVSCCLCMG